MEGRRFARVAALYDIHGNLPALEAVLAELDQVGLVLVGGDVVWGPMPDAVMDRLLALQVPTAFIRGNADREVLDRDPGPYGSLNNWCADRLDDRHALVLEAAPSTVSCEVAGLGSVLFCHGSPRSDEEPLTAVTPPRRLEDVLDGVSEDVVVCGHTHAQFDRTAGRRRIVNPGSVGLPFGAPGAHWAVLGPDVDLRITTYDTEGAAAAFRATGAPGIEQLAAQVSDPPPVSTAESFEPST